MGASTGYRIIMFQDLLFRYIRPGDGKNAACGLKIIFLGGGFFVGTNIWILNVRYSIYCDFWFAFLLKKLS